MPQTYQDDYPSSAKASRLRALGVIRPDMGSVEILFGEGADALRRTVRLSHVTFPNGGGWSFFVCPECGRRVTFLKLDGKPMCTACLGVPYRSARGSPAERAEARKNRIEKLRARLAADDVGRMRPAEGRRRIGDRKKLEMSLRRAEIADRDAFHCDRQRVAKIAITATKSADLEPYYRVKKPLPSSVAKLDLAKVRETLASVDGNVTRAAKELGVPSSDLRRLMLLRPKLTEAAFAAIEAGLDLAQSAILDALKSPNVGLRAQAAKFLLRRSKAGRARGFGDRVGGDRRSEEARWDPLARARSASRQREKAAREDGDET